MKYHYDKDGVAVDSDLELSEDDLAIASMKAKENEAYRVEAYTDDGWLAFRYYRKGRPFERIRRITGYLVGTLERFNDAKKSEEHDRVKHGI